VGRGVAQCVEFEFDRIWAASTARMLIARARKEVSALPVKEGIIELISTIMVYTFTNLSREEIDAMLGTKLEEHGLSVMRSMKGRCVMLSRWFCGC
jgi:predicted transposase YdaD